MIPNVIKFTLIRKKAKGLLFIAILSALCGAAEIYFSHQLTFGNGRFILLTLGVISVLITIFCIRSYYQLYKENFTGMYISDEGIYDISTGTDIGTVLWKDVENIRVMNELGSADKKYIVVKVHNPNEYINRELNRSKRRSLDLKQQYYGSPICFSDRALNCTFEQLKEAVFIKYEHYQATHSETINE